jgi:hypothetical protein
MGDINSLDTKEKEEVIYNEKMYLQAILLLK